MIISSFSGGYGSSGSGGGGGGGQGSDGNWTEIARASLSYTKTGGSVPEGATIESGWATTFNLVELKKYGFLRVRFNNINVNGNVYNINTSDYAYTYIYSGIYDNLISYSHNLVDALGSVEYYVRGVGESSAVTLSSCYSSSVNGGSYEKYTPISRLYDPITHKIKGIRYMINGSSGQNGASFSGDTAYFVVAIYGGASSDKRMNISGTLTINSTAILEGY